MTAIPRNKSEPPKQAVAKKKVEEKPKTKAKAKAKKKKYF